MVWYSLIVIVIIGIVDVFFFSLFWRIEQGFNWCKINKTIDKHRQNNRKCLFSQWLPGKADATQYKNAVHTLIIFTKCTSCRHGSHECQGDRWKKPLSSKYTTVISRRLHVFAAVHSIPPWRARQCHLQSKPVKNISCVPIVSVTWDYQRRWPTMSTVDDNLCC